MKEATVVETEQPKAAKTTKHKEGTDQNAATAGVASNVEGVVTDKKPRAFKPKGTKYRILAGVDATKFRGQRSIVIKALQTLGEGAFTVEEIAAKCEGLVSKTPVEASAKYHLDGMVKAGEVEAIMPAAPVVAATEEIAKAA